MSVRARQAAAALGCLAIGCTLPAEQVTLPAPVNPPAGTAAPVAARPGGVRLNEAPANDREARIYEGSGQFTDFPNPRPNVADVPGRDGVTINLVGATIAEAAKAVLGDILKVHYVISDKVKASVTLQTARPVSREALLEIFEATLRNEGAALVVDRGVYKILPYDEAVASGAPLQARGGNSRAQAGLATQVIPLQFVSATEMERIVKSVAPRATVQRADTARNLIVVVGTKADLIAVADAVAVFDVDFMRGMSVSINPVDSSDPEAIAQELDTLFANDRDGPAKGVVRFVPNKRLKSVLVISSRAEYLHKARTWIERLDKVGRDAEKQVYVYHVQSRPAGELSLLLRRVYNSQDPSRAIAGGLGARPTDPIVAGAIPGGPSPTDPTGTGLRPAGAAVTGLPAPLTPAPIAPTQPAIGGAAGASGVALAAPVGASGLPAPLDAIQAPAPAGASGPEDRMAGISVVADETNNALIVTATPAQFKRVRQILDRIDVTPNQVLLEATIAEVTLNDDLKFGVRWFFKEGKSSFKFSDLASGAVANTFPGFGYFLNTTNIQIALNALSSVTDVNVVSSPTLMVLDNKRAQLQVGDEVPVATQSAVSVLTPGAPIVNSIAFRNTGIILSITPRISDHGRILLEIEQEVSDVVPTTSSTIDSPTIQQRRVKTNVSVNDGESIVLAGLIQDRASLTRDQVPLAGNVPLLGNLFKNKTDRIKRTELLIAITPSVVKDASQSAAVTAEFRDRLNMTLRPQRAGPPDRREQIDRIVR